MYDLNDVKVILFDLDGTLIDTVPQLYLAVQAALNANKLPSVSLDQVRTWIGNGADILLKRAMSQQYYFTEIADSLFQQVKMVFDAHYQAGIDRDYSLYPMVINTLAVLERAGYKMAVVTNKPDEFVQPLLQSAEIAKFFTYTLGGGRLPAKKPDPLPLHYLCKQFNVLPTEALMVGDSKNDIQAAQAAGMPVVGLSYGYNHGEPIENSQPDWVLHRFDELVSLLNLDVRN
jgi:phosphoglycolate phosphatase